MKVHVKTMVAAALASVGLVIAMAVPAQAASGSYSCTGTFSGGARISTTSAGGYVEWHPTNQDLLDPPRTRLVDGTRVFYHGHYQPAGRFKAFSSNVTSGAGTCVQ